MSALAEQYELSKDGRQITVVAKKERKNEEFNILGCPGNLLGQMKNFVKYCENSRKSITVYSNPRKALAGYVDSEDKLDGVTIRDSTYIGTFTFVL